MDLRRLTQNTGCRLLRGDALTEITSVCCDSRCAGPGALFVCLPGRHADGHDFAAQAVAAGAAAVLCTHDVPGLPAGCAVLLAGDPRRAMAALAARLYGEPARRARRRRPTCWQPFCRPTGGGSGWWAPTASAGPGTGMI